MAQSSRPTSSWQLLCFTRFLLSFRSQHLHCHITAMTSTSTTQIPATTGYIPAPVSCYSNSFPGSLDYTGLNGTVCAISVPPATFNLTQCCQSPFRVFDNCTQFCETKRQGNMALDSSEFSNCVREGNNGTFLTSMCGEYMNGSSVNETQPGANAGMSDSSFYLWRDKN